MANRRAPLPVELKELVDLIKKGYLFAVQDRLRSSGARQEHAEEFEVAPLLAAVKTGFHSMVEVLLQAGAAKENLNRVLDEAVGHNRLDLVELLCRYGADPKSVSYDIVVSTHDPLLLRFFECQGIDLETKDPLAVALQNKNRAALGTYMRLRNAKPALLRQINMALRFHAGDGNLKWVSLLLWAGADPRARVPLMDERFADLEGTALEESVSNGHVEVIKKFKLDPTRDDMTALLRESSMAGQPEVAKMLMSLGADPGHGEEGSALRSYVHSLAWSLEGLILRNRPRSIVEVLCLFASMNAKWTVIDRDSFGGLRRALAKTGGLEAVNVLSQLVAAGFFTEEVFRKLMSTSRMQEVLRLPYGGVAGLRKFAEPNQSRRRRNSL